MISQIGIFDIIGPVMVGPSSSHTAGAVKLGLAAKKILGEDVCRAEIGFHGSFAATYWGHKTDLAILGGLLGLSMDDPNISRAEELAEKEGLKYRFLTTDLGDVHPNSVKLKLEGTNFKAEVVGSSIGGGRVKVSEIEGFEISVDGTYTVLLTQHTDAPGIVAEVTTKLAQYNINIAFLEVSRQQRGSDALLVAQTDDPLNKGILDDIGKISGVKVTRILPVF